MIDIGHLWGAFLITTLRYRFNPMFKTALVTDIHRSNREWLNLIQFYRDEIKIMENRMAEVASKNTGKEVLSRLEHFQNQAIIHKAHLDDLQGEIVRLEDIITDEVKKNKTASDHRRHESPEKIKNAMDSFQKLFYQLREEFKEYLIKVL
jgi:hypothetical protein